MIFQVMVKNEYRISGVPCFNPVHLITYHTMAILTMAILIETDGTQSNIKPKGLTFTLNELQNLVGGFIQVIVLPDGRPLIMDEEGKLKDKSYNEKATTLARTAGIADADFLVGRCILCEEGEMCN